MNANIHSAFSTLLDCLTSNPNTHSEMIESIESQSQQPLGTLFNKLNLIAGEHCQCVSLRNGEAFTIGANYIVEARGGEACITDDEGVQRVAPLSRFVKVTRNKDKVWQMFY